MAERATCVEEGEMGPIERADAARRAATSARVREAGAEVGQMMEPCAHCGAGMRVWRLDAARLSRITHGEEGWSDYATVDVSDAQLILSRYGMVTELCRRAVALCDRAHGTATVGRMVSGGVGCVAAGLGAGQGAIGSTGSATGQ